MEKKRLVAARYVRNSDPSKKDSEVQQAQLNALTAYAEQHGYEVSDALIYRDAVSALKHPYWEREGLMQTWDDSERGMFDVVLVTEFFRVARTSAEQAAVIQFYKRYNVELISITENFEDTPEGRLLFHIQGFLGEVEAQKVMIRTSRGKLHRAKRALTGQGKHPMYGYVWVDGEDYTRERYGLNTVVIHTDSTGKQWTEQDVIVFCHDCCLQGMSLYTIALTLTRLGIPTHQGNQAWDPSTVRNILTNICYTGEGYNGRYTDEPFRTKDGLYPKIIDKDIFERTQRQLAINSEMSIRNNRHPKIGLMRGLMYCGICNHKMWVHFTAKPKKPGWKVKPPIYMCYQNDGIEETLHHHSLTITLSMMDKLAWEFAVPYIQDETKMRRHIAEMRSQVNQRDHSQDLKNEIAKLNKSINNLFSLAETADPDDRDNMEALQTRLAHFQREKREKEKLLNSVTSVEERQEKLLAALDRFELWTRKVRPFLEDPDYEISFEDMREAMLVLGVKCVVWPALPGYEERHRLTLLPPDIGRCCDDDFTKYAVKGRKTL